MARRIEIELTSARPDGTWTWRAAGALNPRGALDASLLYRDAKVGDVVRAEAEFGMEGITVVSVEPPRQPEAEDPNRIQLLDRPVVGAVTTQLAGRARPGLERGPAARPDRVGPERRRSGGPEEGPGEHINGNGRAPAPDASRGPAGRHERPSRERPGRPPVERPARTGGSPGGSGPQGTTAPGSGEAARRNQGDDRPSATGRAPRPGRPSLGPGRSGPGRPRGAPPNLREGTAGRSGNHGAGGGEMAGPRAQWRGGQRPGEHSGQDDRGGPSPRPASRQRRLTPGSAHRNAMLEALPAEQRPIAQQLLRGGIPAVRTALHFERERAREEGRPEPSTEGVLAIAESLVSRVKAAEWRDRAEAALKGADDLAMRDLRSLVSGSELARDEASRELVVALREMLERRVEAHRSSWEQEVSRLLEEGHVLRALRLSARPPDPGARFSAELATRLRDAASAALSPSSSSDKWLAVLLAVVETPVRRTVKPEGLPASPTPELLEAARKQCGRVPALAPLLGISVPPPPGPARPHSPSKPPVLHVGRRAPRAARPAPERARQASKRASEGAGERAGTGPTPEGAGVGAPAQLNAEPDAQVDEEPAEADGPGAPQGSAETTSELEEAPEQKSPETEEQLGAGPTLA